MWTSRKTDFCSRVMTTKGLTSRTMALHVYYKTLYISELSLQNNVKSFCVFKTTRVPTANVSCFYWKVKPAFTYFDAVRQTEYIQPFAKFVREIQVNFLIDVFLDACHRCLNSLMVADRPGTL